MEILHTTLSSPLPNTQSGWLNAASRVTAAYKGQPWAGPGGAAPAFAPRLKTTGARPDVQSPAKQREAKSSRRQYWFVHPPPGKPVLGPGKGGRKGSHHRLKRENKPGVRSKMNPRLEKDFLNKMRNAFANHRNKTLIDSLTLKLRHVAHWKHLKERKEAPSRAGETIFTAHTTDKMLERRLEREFLQISRKRGHKQIKRKIRKSCD